MKKKYFLNKGYSIAEVVIYASIFAILLIIIVNMLINISHSRGRLSSAQSINASAITAMDRIVREIRVSENVDTAESTFGVSPGTLVLTSIDADDSLRTVEFSLSSGVLHIMENGVDVGPLTQDDSSVTELLFMRGATSTVQAIKVEMTIESGAGDTYKSEKFYSTTLLRQSI